MARPSSVSVILSTYNAPEHLEKALLGYSIQDTDGFDIVIADDGSGPETHALIERMCSEVALPLQHVWQEDQGFRKTAILNKAIMSTESEYLFFSDGDCIPRADLLRTHLELAEAGFFLSAGYFKLPQDVSARITREAVLANQATDPHYLRGLGLRPSRKEIRLRVGPRMGRFMDAITTTRSTWKGHNVSGWRSDLLEVNGFDERMTYWGEDLELGARLNNIGIDSKQIRHRAICVHLWHERGYDRKEEIEANRAILRNTTRRKIKYTPYGIRRENTVPD